MYRVTCSKKDCLTPHFYVDLADGQVVLTHTPVVDAFSAAVASLRKVKGDEGIEGKSILENLGSKLEVIQGDQNQLNTGLTETEEIEFDDYLVVYCDAGHKNYILTKSK